MEESTIREKMKKRRQHKNESEENGENEDRLSDMSNCVLLHILSFLDTKQVVQTCVLSTKWKHIWKRVPSLKLCSSRFPQEKLFATFVSKILKLRDSSTALNTLDIYHQSNIKRPLLKKILKCVYSHNTRLQKLGISVNGDNGLIMSCVSSCRALTSLTITVYPRNIYAEELFPKSLNLPALTSLDIMNFTFCGDENGWAEPFLAFPRLNSLIIRSCQIKDAKILKISSETLANLAMLDNSFDFAELELFAPSLCTFTFTGKPLLQICRSGLSSVKHVTIYARMYSKWEACPRTLFSWILYLFNVKSLTISATTLQILNMIPGLLEVKLPSLCNLKSMEIKLEPLQVLQEIFSIVKEGMLVKATAKSRKEAAELREAFKTGLKPTPIPNGIVDFLLQNSRSAKVDITDF